MDEVTLNYFVAKRLSPELVNLALRLGINVKSWAYEDRDKSFAAVADIKKKGVSLRLFAYLGPLVSILARACKLEVSAEDCLVLENLLQLLSCLMRTILSCTVNILSSQRRRIARLALGILYYRGK